MVSAANCNTHADGDAFDKTPCAESQLRFTIFVRPIDCSSIKDADGKAVECSSDLHRESCYDKPNMCGSFINVASLTTRTDDDDDDDDDDNDDDNTFDVVAPQPRSSCTQTKVR